MKIETYEKLQLKKSVVALGKFEGLHLGHMLLIDKVIELSKENNMNSVICSINFSGKGLINTDEERYNILKDKGIDVIANCEFNKEFAAMSPEEFFDNILIDKLDAKYIVVGSDFMFGANRAGNTSTLKLLGEKHGTQVVIIDKMSIDDHIVSSSYIKELISTGDVSNAKKYMGRPYKISGIVAHGKELGRTIGFPTINLKPDSNKLLPAFGVYKTTVVIDNNEYVGVTNVGNNPTIDDENKVVIETNIFDFDGDLYDKEVTLYFERFVRKEQKFDSIDALKEQIGKDIANIMHQ